jgi:hypothetical protein
MKKTKNRESKGKIKKISMHTRPKSNLRKSGIKSTKYNHITRRWQHIINFVWKLIA